MSESNPASNEHTHTADADIDCGACHLLFARQLAADYRRDKAAGIEGRYTCHQSWLLPLVDEIERLTRERDEAQAEWAALSQDDGKVERALERVEAERDRLRAALERFVNAYQPHVMEARCRVCDLAWQNAREALSGEHPPSETTNDPWPKCPYCKARLEQTQVGRFKCVTCDTMAPRPSEKASAEPAQSYQRKCSRCGKMGPSATPEGVGGYYCSIECAD